MNSSVIVLWLAVFLHFKLYPQPNIIFDTDFGGDADDLGALAMLHHFTDKNQCRLLAIMSWSLERYTVPAIDAVNRYYGHPDIPIGTRKGLIHDIDWNYNKCIAENFSYRLTYQDAPDATYLYRKILSQSPDTSIIIVTVGPLANIKNLIESPSDSLSEWNGKELIRRKVKMFVIMGGKFPKGKKEWNFDGNMPGVTRFVIQHIDTPIVFSGYEVGLKIKTGKCLNTEDENSPLYVGFMHFSRNAPWMKKKFKGKILNKSSYDQTAVLYAVKNGEGLYWRKIRNGICLPD
ncbi:MAG: nucleoside hydrolase, partial [Cytophagaceae bacterium]|nr:nucleoside hydrolase [Cytophagaceae bacterium]MDW8455519.1 nucleoside hydrolase [Cytophagaceae bacterium]